MSDLFEKHSHRIQYGATSGCWLWAAGMDSSGYGQIVNRKILRHVA